MALTKHQRLAKSMQNSLDDLKFFYEKVAAISHVLQLHFYETHWILGRPLISERVLKAMMYTHRCSLRLFSPHPEVRKAAQEAPLIGCIINPPFNLAQRVLTIKEEIGVCLIPWGVKIVLPSENLQKLEDTQFEALLYSASLDEMAEWIDWNEKEDKANTLTNHLCVLYQSHKEAHPAIQNLLQKAAPLYQTIIAKHLAQDPKVREKTLRNLHFAPKEDSTIADAHYHVSESIRTGKKRELIAFQRLWQKELRTAIFHGLNWKIDRQEEVLKRLFPGKRPVHHQIAKPRWETSFTVDRKTFGAFLLYFTQKFLENPLKNHHEGEIALLLRIIPHIAKGTTKTYTYAYLLTLTTKNIGGNTLILDQGEIEICQGLETLLKAYIGEKSQEREQKLFPHLTQDNLEDYFRRASKELLPNNCISALPEAFLPFPHPHENTRVNPHYLKQQRKNPFPILHDPISRHELKKQLLEKLVNLPQ